MSYREPELRAILLGASNLRVALPAVLHGVRRKAAGPVEAWVACGHGRSYGGWSRFLFVRRLPGIAGCGLWQELERHPPLRTIAVMTDIGNDLVYGAGVEQIATWIEACLDRLAKYRAETVLTLLPMARLERLSGREVRLATSILFPGRPAPWPELLERARALNGRLRRLGRERGAHLVEPAAEWYGLDPIHLRRSARREAWDRILSFWPPDPGSPDRLPRDRVRIPLLGASELRLFGLTLRHSQPAARLADGTTLSFY